jgi:hypothetical protein
MPAPKGNNFAAKDPADKVSASLFVRLTPSEKELCCSVATDASVSAWAREILLDAARREQTTESLVQEK